jgi:uncharacterized protein DUF3363
VTRRVFARQAGRPVIDRQLGREVSGIVQGGSVSWQLGRHRGLGVLALKPIDRLH